MCLHTCTAVARLTLALAKLSCLLVGNVTGTAQMYTEQLIRHLASETLRNIHKLHCPSVHSGEAKRSLNPHFLPPAIVVICAESKIGLHFWRYPIFSHSTYER